MTLVTDIILSALRETNLIPLGVAPSSAQELEAFALLATIVSGIPGGEAGENLTPLALGQDNIDAPSGYPWWSNELPANVFVRANTRLMLNLTAEGFASFDPTPHDGARMGVVDCALNLDVNNITLFGNGRLIDGDTELTLTTPGTSHEWVYREDIGSWTTVTPLSLDGQMPWPSEFDDMFIIMLALRLNPRYGQVIHPASAELLKKARSAFSARYSQSWSQMPSEAGLLYLTNIDSRNIYRQYGDTSGMFNSGVPY